VLWIWPQQSICFMSMNGQGPSLDAASFWCKAILSTWHFINCHCAYCHFSWVFSKSTEAVSYDTRQTQICYYGIIMTPWWYSYDDTGLILQTKLKDTTIILKMTIMTLLSYSTWKFLINFYTVICAVIYKQTSYN